MKLRKVKIGVGVKQRGLYSPEFEHDSCGVGFVCNIKGERSFDILTKGIEVLRRLSHRGAVGADPDTGDGAGILIQVPHAFLLKECKKTAISLPDAGLYGTGLVFLPTDKKERNFCINVFEEIIKNHNQSLLGWRKVPSNESIIGKTARATKPEIMQVFIGRGPGIRDQIHFERMLYVIRRLTENEISGSELIQKSFFYISNLSSRTLSYKGLLKPEQLSEFFPDLKDKTMETALCLVHSRYSTNTFPTWDLAQPFRFLAHNGEINTLRGNINWVRAKERLLSSEFFGNDIEKIKPVIVEGKSDSAAIDNFFELLALTGRPLPQVMMMLIPGAWEHDRLMEEDLREFYKYYACFLEPWDGPAAIAFSDGKRIGAVLDRNGLRPARYVITKSGLVIMASEVGVLDIAPSDIKVSGRLKPGRIFFIDTELGRIIDDDELKKEVSGKRPYKNWNSTNLVNLDNILSTGGKTAPNCDITERLKAFGYTREDLKFIIKPMAEEGKEPVGSMGNDTPHAVLSLKPQLLYSYFKQLFAQVTNPAIDPIREEIVMSLDTFIGPGWNILEDIPKHSHKLRVKNPILDNDELEKIRNISINNFKTKTIYTFFDGLTVESFTQTLARICSEAEYAVEKGYNFIILSDYGIDKDRVPLPALLATSAVHQHLVRKTIRSQAGIVVESGEPREVHHFALLFGYGADCINPYLAYEAVENLQKDGFINLQIQQALKNYKKAVCDGILKVLSKMGISTLRSYRGAQIFEALGLNDKIISEYFTGTISRIGGVSIEEIANETIQRHKDAFYARNDRADSLPTGGIYQWKRDGEFHLWNPESISALQDAVRENNRERYKEFSTLIDDQSAHPVTLRSLLKFTAAKPINIEEVEPAKEILKRFATGAMSFGSISKPAHETLAIAMNRIGAKSNSGEGGEDPERFKALPNGDSKRSAIKQVASGRFGVTINYLINADEIQIKIAQGAKPGEGGQLPGHKVSKAIAKTRYTTPSVTLISPPPHHDIYSIEDLAQLIFDLKNANPKARISVKLVSEAGVGTVAAGVAKGHADTILISGGDGGTGASPRSSIMHAGLPWELGLSETHQTLVLNNLRSRVKLQTDGQMRTGRDVVIAALLGAEEYAFCTAPLVAMGCVMLRHCHLNNCSVGVATQDDALQKRFSGKPEYVINYFHFVAQELREIMASLGLRTVNEMIGRTDLLQLRQDITPDKAKGLDYSRILYKPDMPDSVGRYCKVKQNHKIEDILDKKLIHLCKGALDEKKPVKVKMDINNADRATGVMLSSQICRSYGEEGLPEDTIHCKFTGIAGQSFGSFLSKGVTFELEGMANDYVGKSISGGKIIIYPFKEADYEAGKNIIIGNTAFYGAISGHAYIRGVAGERFCIRNSGLSAVVEGTGDHGCEYMTGGRVVILGETGRNFAAGMSGGIAYVYDEDENFKHRCNKDMVSLEKIEAEDKDTICAMLKNHFKYTKSEKAKKILDEINREMKKFVKVIPIEYKNILEGTKTQKQLNLLEASDG